MSPLRRIVIVGNGITGVTAADTLRTEGYDGEITLVGDERHAAYSRPALSKALLRDASDLTAHLLPPPAHGAVERLGVAATDLDLDGRTVHLDDGGRLPFDGLVVASGCRPRRLGDAGGESGEVTLRSLDDAWLLRGRIAPRPRVVVVGGGPLGMEIASSCIDVGCEVTLVSQGEPLEMQLGRHLSEVLVAAAHERGLRILRTEAARVLGTGEDTRVVLADGAPVAGDLVVTAAGDLPNVEWLASSGLLEDSSLTVDDRGRVQPHIVAAGDVAARPTPFGLRRVPTWTAAIETSKVAARALLHGDDAAPVEARPYFWTEQFGLSLKTVGHLPLTGTPTLADGEADGGRSLLRWHDPGTEAAAAINYRIPVPRLRRLCAPAA